MPERYTENIQRLEFEVVQPGDNIAITTGRKDEAWHYSFDVDRVGNTWPQGVLKATDPSGQEMGSGNFALHGCGRWTTRQQNPVQTQERGFTPYYDGLIIGNFLFGKLEGQADRVVFDRRGQEISEIVRTPYRENLIIDALATKIGPMSVREVVEYVDSAIDPGVLNHRMTNKDIRQTLAGLVKLDRVSLIKKKVQLFELTAK